VPNRQREIIWLRETSSRRNSWDEVQADHGLGQGHQRAHRHGRSQWHATPADCRFTARAKSVASTPSSWSILYKATPDQVRLILVDPKRLELGNYEGVPHLYTPIITDEAGGECVAQCSTGDGAAAEIAGGEGRAQYRPVESAVENGTPSLFEEGVDDKPIPYIVIIIDELADLMMLDSSNVEESITRLAQMARAVGIHLVLATQRPSVDVITG